MNSIFHRTCNTTYECRLLTDSDLDTYNEYKKNVLRDALTNAKTPESQIKEITGDITPISTVEQTRHRVLFGLFDGEKMIGETSIAFSPTSTFTGSHILQAYAGKRLANLLYDIRIQYLLQKTKTKSAITHIEPHKYKSAYAATRNGFTQDFSDSAKFTINLDELRNELAEYELTCMP